MGVGRPTKAHYKPVMRFSRSVNSVNPDTPIGRQQLGHWRLRRLRWLLEKLLADLMVVQLAPPGSLGYQMLVSCLKRLKAVP